MKLYHEGIFCPFIIFWLFYSVHLLISLISAAEPGYYYKATVEIIKASIKNLSSVSLLCEVLYLLFLFYNRE